MQNQKSTKRSRFLSLVICVSIHNLSQVIDGRNNDLSVCNAVICLSVQRRISVSIPLQVQFMNLIVSSRCSILQVLHYFMTKMIILSLLSLNVQSENKWLLFSWVPRSCRQLWEYLFCKTSTASLLCSQLFSEMSRWHGKWWSTSIGVLYSNPSLGPHRSYFLTVYV